MGLWLGLADLLSRRSVRTTGFRHHVSSPYDSTLDIRCEITPSSGESVVTLPTLCTQVPDRTLTPYGGRRSGQVFPSSDRGTISETGSLRVPGLMDCFIYTRTTFISLPKGFWVLVRTTPPVEKRGDMVSRTDVYVPLCVLDVSTHSRIDDWQ